MRDQLKWKIIIGMVLFLTGVGILFDIINGNSDHKIELIRYQHISDMEIYDYGLFGKSDVTINNKDSIALISKLLKNSKPIGPDTTDLKDNRGYCEIVINYDDKHSMTFDFTKTIYSGGIIQSGSYYYVNNSLLDFVIKKLKRTDDQ